MPERPPPIPAAAGHGLPGAAPTGATAPGGDDPDLRMAAAAGDSAMVQLLWRGLPMLLAVVGPDGRLGATNPAWQPLLGLEPAQLRGQLFLSLVHADDDAAAQRWMRRVLDGAGPAGFSGRWRHADGRHLGLRWTLALRDGLACAIGQPDAGADVAQQVRQQTLRSVARLTSGLSHDFNNLLQVLRNTLELMQQRPDDPRQVARWAGSALRIVDRGADLTGQLLAFAGSQRLSPQSVPVAALLQGLRDRLDGLLGPAIRLQLDLPADGSLASADAAQLELALLNLALNAVDAMPLGGRLLIRQGRAHVEDDAELATGDYVTIDVADSGSGMSAAVRERALEPFFTTRPLGRGRGLGLSQVHGFMQQIGGAVRILPPAGTGLTVRLLLPAAAPPPPPRPGATLPGPGLAPGWQPQLLLVVDDAEQRRLLQSALQLRGYTRVLASDGTGARQLIDQQPPDVVVLGLPPRPVSPEELARRARRLRPGVGVVRLDTRAAAQPLPLDIDALAQDIARAAGPPR